MSLNFHQDTSVSFIPKIYTKLKLFLAPLIRWFQPTPSSVSVAVIFSVLFPSFSLSSTVYSSPMQKHSIKTLSQVMPIPPSNLLSSVLPFCSEENFQNHCHKALEIQALLPLKVTLTLLPLTTAPNTLSCLPNLCWPQAFLESFSLSGIFQMSLCKTL